MPAHVACYPCSCLSHAFVRRSRMRFRHAIGRACMPPVRCCVQRPCPQIRRLRLRPLLLLCIPPLAVSHAVPLAASASTCSVPPPHLPCRVLCVRSSCVHPLASCCDRRARVLPQLPLLLLLPALLLSVCHCSVVCLSPPSRSAAAHAVLARASFLFASLYCVPAFAHDVCFHAALSHATCHSQFCHSCTSSPRAVRPISISGSRSVCHCRRLHAMPWSMRVSHLPPWSALPPSRPLAC